MGVLMLYAGDGASFDDEEMALLADLGADVSFGIQAKRDAAALEEHQAELTLFRRAMDGSTDAFFVADAETGRFVDFNESAARQLGYAREELLAMGPPDIAPHLQDPETWAEVLEAAGRTVATVRRSVHVRKDGSDFPVEISFSLMSHRGRTLVLAISRDVSARDAAERESEALRIQLEQAQKMESVGRLAGGVAHDFNNLLTVVNATADLVLAELDTDAPHREELEEIRSAGERAARLTRQLLAFSRRQVMHPRHVQVNDVVRDFLDMIRRVIGEQIVLEAALGDDLPLIEGDAGQLEQVLMNLCVNARDAMPRGGTLTIATRKVTLSEADASRHVAMSAGEHVLLSVADTGEGMDEATQARIFEPFFTTKAQGKGTGLGLSTAYGIVKQSGGTIWAYSEMSLGTTFKVYFPAARNRSSSALMGTDGPPGTETILPGGGRGAHSKAGAENPGPRRLLRPGRPRPGVRRWRSSTVPGAGWTWSSPTWCCLACPEPSSPRDSPRHIPVCASCSPRGTRRKPWPAGSLKTGRGASSGSPTPWRSSSTRYARRWTADAGATCRYISRTNRFCLSTRMSLGSTGASPSSKPMMMSSSPFLMRCAAAPFISTAPEPLGASMM